MKMYNTNTIFQSSWAIS